MERGGLGQRLRRTRANGVAVLCWPGPAPGCLTERMACLSSGLARADKSDRPGWAMT